MTTFWQSDGIAPHILNIQFLKKASVSKICFYVDYGSDESYTPKKVVVRSGTTQQDLQDVAAIELHEPLGWCQVSLTSDSSGGGADCECQKPQQPLRTHLLQLRVASMHQNGRDTHIRQIKVLGPREAAYENFKTTAMTQFASLR